MDAAAGSKLVTKRLVYVCFAKHLFLVLFLAARAAGCQQGSWFLVLGADVTPSSLTHTHTLG